MITNKKGPRAGKGSNSGHILRYQGGTDHEQLKNERYRPRKGQGQGDHPG